MEQLCQPVGIAAVIHNIFRSFLSHSGLQAANQSKSGMGVQYYQRSDYHQQCQSRAFTTWSSIVSCSLHKPRVARRHAVDSACCRINQFPQTHARIKYANLIQPTTNVALLLHMTAGAPYEFLLCSQFHPRSLHLYAVLVLCERFQPSLSCFFHLLKVNKSIGIIKAPSRTHWESLHMSTCPSRSEKRHSSLIYVSKCFLFFSCPESFLNDKHSFYGE